MTKYDVIGPPARAWRLVATGAGFALAAWGLNYIVSETLEPSFLPLFFAAVVVATWYAGTLSGIVAISICLPGILFFGEPAYEFSWKGDDDLLRMLLFTIVSAMVIAIDNSRRTQIIRNAETQASLRENQGRLQLALNAGRMGTWEWNIPAMKTLWSAEAETMHGLTPGTFGGTPAHFLFAVHPDDREATQLAIARSLASGAPDIDLEYRTIVPTGEVRWIAAKGGVQRGLANAPLLVVGVVWDITDRKRAEIALQENAEELRRANAVKDEFLGMVSHELRNPITAIYTGARLLQARYDTVDETSRAEVLSDVEHEAERLHLIVENLLALAREEFAPMAEREPVSINRTIEAAVSRVRKARPGRKFVFNQNGESYAMVVPIYLDLVLRNLIDNADKYSPVGQPIELSAGQDNGDVLISVRDHGPGVSEEDRDRMFERFYRAPGVRSVSGAGIGLTVCQRLVENQGGTIAAANDPEGGLRIEVRVPAFKIDELD